MKDAEPVIASAAKQSLSETEIASSSATPRNDHVTRWQRIEFCPIVLRRLMKVLHEENPGYNPTVSVVVPVYRNAETLAELSSRLCTVLEAQRLSFEILFVDDACPAGSLSVLEELTRNNPRIAVLALARNVGQHRAVVTGLAHARGEWMVVMDADLQDQPEVIPVLLAAGQDGVAAVFAGRRGRYESRARLWTSYLFKGLLHLLCGVPADAGLFVALHRRIVDQLLMMAGERPRVTAMIGCSGLPLVSVPVVRDQRREGSSAYSSWRRIQSGWRAIAWVLGWKWRTRRGVMPDPFTPPVITAYLGKRFARHEG